MIISGFSICKMCVLLSLVTAMYEWVKALACEGIRRFDFDPWLGH